ncbi:ABC transporter ATP-binding protein [Pseudomonas sp. ATCC PTA-122608]|jgi:putative ABC transport system ATP-binding protein|uniref:ABC transporter ATP-binding protein n=1 Tax=Pseudomonas sp. ATCC PTA-122608 TaxID=1771311 RepID=UPI00096BA960|nr:ABC transporter ATP-binding protein [Pseudomonas sp. ATCC PTA-122608]OLY72999.1 ABC transporter ATP-binding protein [Pseudomonas sp. ATCC PTA-122608]
MAVAQLDDIHLDKFISLIDITKCYQLGGKPCHVLKGTSLFIGAKESCAILGASGSGKSTLLNILGLLDLPDSGQYRFAGHDVLTACADQLAALRNRQIGFVFQNFNLIARMTALENVALPLSYRGVGRREALLRAKAMLEQVGLCDRSAHRPADLSGGQRQRVAIARALVGQPSLILADEPTGNLDHQTAHDIMDLLLSLNREHGTTLVVVTHDPAIARRLDRQIRVIDSVVQEDRQCLA